MRTRLETQFIGKPFQIQAEGCYAITFFRPLVSNPVSINGVPLEAGQSFSVKQNVGDEDWTTYEVVFYTGTDTNECYVSRVLPIR
jgi:hypothetical protein